MSSFRTLDDLKPAGKRVLVRCDLNVPMQGGKVTDATRIERSATTLKELARMGARVIILSHFGRPRGKFAPEFSLAPLVDPLSAALGQKIAFAADCIGKPALEAVSGLTDGQILLLENLRFHAAEETNDKDFAAELASLGDLYVNDAFMG